MLPHSQTQVWGQAGQALCHRHAALPPQWAAPRPHQPSQRQVRPSIGFATLKCSIRQVPLQARCTLLRFTCLLQVRESQKQRTNHCGAQRRVHTLAAGVVEGPASAEVWPRLNQALHCLLQLLNTTFCLLENPTFVSTSPLTFAIRQRGAAALRYQYPLPYSNR